MPGDFSARRKNFSKMFSRCFRVGQMYANVDDFEGYILGRWLDPGFRVQGPREKTPRRHDHDKIKGSLRGAVKQSCFPWGNS